MLINPGDSGISVRELYTMHGLNGFDRITSIDTTIGTATEQEHPLVVADIWRMHGDNYRQHGYVDVRAFNTDGSLLPHIDNARGDNVTYLVAFDNLTGRPVASYRKINGPLEDLPSYKKCHHAIDPEVLLEIKGWQELGYTVEEIAALNKEKYVTPDVIMSLYREGLIQSIDGHKIWFMGLVQGTLSELERLYGKRIIRRIGEPVPLVCDGVKDGVTLTPTLLIPHMIFDGLSREAQYARDKGNLPKYYAMLFNMQFYDRRHKSDTRKPDRRHTNRALGALAKVG
ncbi:MAG: hypothetical protein MUF85_02840 [Patescibacteria group bacterium]|jgi:hypothetical protein|nr:hypothetical protein [Patescibacteria group bacterium]